MPTDKEADGIDAESQPTSKAMAKKSKGRFDNAGIKDLASRVERLF